MSAAGLQFSTQEIDGDADVANTISFDNQDAGVAHNVAIFRDAGFTDNAFTGDLVTGPSSIEYSLPALPAATYYFRCDVHPAMQGVYVVGGA
jgi:plastocyanin